MVTREAYLEETQPLLVIIGPSGSGKSSVVRELHRHGLVEITPSWTTRPPRKGEIEETTQHRFVSEKEFSAKERENYFLEVATLFGLPYRYGMPRIRKPEKGRIPLVILRTDVLRLLKGHYPNALVYQIEDRDDYVRQRLQQRQARGENIGTRLEKYESEKMLGRARANRVFLNQSTISELADRIEAALREDFGNT